MDTASILLSFTTVFFCIFIVQWIVGRLKKHQVLRQHGIPGPAPSLFSGSMYQLRERQRTDVISSWIREYGNIFGFYIGEVPYVVINDLDMLKQILIKDFSNFINRPEQHIDIHPLDKSLESIKDKRWKEVRTILSPTFSSAKMKLMFGLVNKKVDVTVDVVSRKAKGGEPFDIYDVMQKLTLDVIAHCALAMKTHCQENENDAFMESARHFASSIRNIISDLMLMFPFMEALMRRFFRYTAAGQEADSILQSIEHVIKERLKNSDSKSVDLLQLMLDCRDMTNSDSSGQHGIKMTDEEIACNAYLMLLAGYETTSTALGYTFYLLVTHPEVQQKLYSEISVAEDCSYNTLQSLQYLDQVIQESLRIHPPVTDFTSRTSKQDYPLGKVTIPAGAKIMSPVWHIHRDPNIWPDPDQFNPDRFEPGHQRHSLAYQPFGVGPRNCIGSRFALLEMKLVLFKLLRKFRFEKCVKTVVPLQLKFPEFLVQPDNGVWVKAVERNN